MYDLLIVGAGLTAATLVARLRTRLRICVLDGRPHLAGNCFDRTHQGTWVHQYGPHIFHCSDAKVIAFLSGFTQWVPYTHEVLAEIQEDGALRRVPFPYCRQTARVLGRELATHEIIDAFFRGYSEKMWDLSWEDLPESIRGRIPLDVSEQPMYHRDEFVALPKAGYTRMIKNMLDGCELFLGVGPLEWTHMEARQVVYTGRADLVPVPGQTITIAQQQALELSYRTSDIDLAPETWEDEAVSVHACTRHRAWTRKTCYARMTGGSSALVGTEYPRRGTNGEWVPLYPLETAITRTRYKALAQAVHAAYPQMRLAGRLGSYRYLDMHQTVRDALALADALMGDRGNS
jgi:UDP-galactopyranose mutase